MVKLGLGATLGISGIAVIAVLAFIFRDKISGFFSDITGGVKGAGEIGETVGLLNRNLQSNLTLTPLPQDPIFGTEGIFAKISKGISDFKFPEITFPTFDFFPSASALPTEPQVKTDLDFTDVGMASARARQNIEQEPSILPQGNIVRDLFNIPFAVANVEETQAEFQERAGAFVQALPEVTAFTSLPDSRTDFVRRQLSRNQEDFESILEAEARRSETIFAGLFGNVQNPNF